MYSVFQRNVKDYKYMICIDNLKGYQKDCVDLQCMRVLGVSQDILEKFFELEKIVNYRISIHGNIYFKHKADANKFIEWLVSLVTMKNMYL